MYSGLFFRRLSGRSARGFPADRGKNRFFGLVPSLPEIVRRFLLPHTPRSARLGDAAADHGAARLRAPWLAFAGRAREAPELARELGQVAGL